MSPPAARKPKARLRGRSHSGANSPAYSGAAKARIVLVEDHPVTRQGLAQLISCQDDLQICGQVSTAAEAMQTVEQSKANLVITDLVLAGSSGLELIKNLACRFPALPVLVLSTYDEALYAERALHAGARGYVMKSEPMERIFCAIRQVLQGKVYLSSRMSERAIGRFARGDSVALGSAAEQLSDRELEVFELIGRGRSTAEIATALKVHPSTVATHRAHIQAKLNVESLGELMRHAVQWVQRQGP
jgi:DNA-binding NarL/FixJ family response regulator